MVMTLSVSLPIGSNGWNVCGHCLWPRIVKCFNKCQPDLMVVKDAQVHFIQHFMMTLWQISSGTFIKQQVCDTYTLSLHKLSSQHIFFFLLFSISLLLSTVELSSVHGVFAVYAMLSFFFLFFDSGVLLSSSSPSFLFFVVVVDNVRKFLKHMFICHEHGFILCLW